MDMKLSRLSDPVYLIRFELPKEFAASRDLGDYRKARVVKLTLPLGLSGLLRRSKNLNAAWVNRQVES